PPSGGRPQGHNGESGCEESQIPTSGFAGRVNKGTLPLPEGPGGRPPPGNSAPVGTGLPERAGAGVLSTPAAERKGPKRSYNASAQEKLNHDRPERIGLGSKLNRRRCRNVKNHSDGGKGALADSAPRNHGCDTVEKLIMAGQLL